MSIDAIKQGYRTILRREADDAGLQYYQSQLDSGRDVNSILGEISQSEEAQKYGTLNPQGFAGFFKEYGPAQDALNRQSAGGSQLSGQTGNAASLSSALTSKALAGLEDGSIEKAASDAGLAARSSMEQQRAANQRGMARMGINPASGRFQASNADAAQGALAEVVATNNARTTAEEAALGRANNAATQAYRGATLGLQMDTSMLGAAERAELNNRQQDLNAANLALDKYRIENGVSQNNKVLDAQAEAAKGSAWGNALNFGLGLAKDSGLLAKAGDAAGKWMGW